MTFTLAARWLHRDMIFCRIMRGTFTIRERISDVHIYKKFDDPIKPHI